MKRVRVLKRGAERREQIIASAIELIRDDGIDGFTISSLAARAGIVLGTMYQYYNSINDVLFDAMRTVNNRYYEQIDYALSHEGDPKDKLIGFIETNFRKDIFSPEYRMVWLAFWAKVPFDERLQTLSFTMQEQSRGRLAEVLSALGVDGETEAYGLWTFIDGLWLRGTLGKQSITATRALQMAYTYTERMLGTNIRASKK